MKNRDTQGKFLVIQEKILSKITLLELGMLQIYSEGALKKPMI